MRPKQNKKLHLAAGQTSQLKFIYKGPKETAQWSLWSRFKALAMTPPITLMLRPQDEFIIGVIFHVLNHKDTKVTLLNNASSASIIKYDFPPIFQ